MNELKHSRPNGQISAEAAEWLIEFRTGEVSAASRATFDAWIRSSPEHLRAYLEMATIWHDSGEIDRWQAIDVQALIERARTEVNLIPLEVGPAGPARESVDEPPSHFSAARLARDRMSSLYRGRVAVTALLCSVAVVWTLFLWWQHGREPTYSTATGEQRTVRLSDGSTVELNSRSGIRVRFSEHERDVELLEGQALFRVATVHDRPFVVLCDNTRIQAVGTQFDVNRKPGMTVVTVVEGRIAVAPEALSSSGVADTPAIGATTAILAAAAPDRGSTYLSAGQQLAVARGPCTAAHRCECCRCHGVASAATRSRVCAVGPGGRRIQPLQHQETHRRGFRQTPAAFERGVRDRSEVSPALPARAARYHHPGNGYGNSYPATRLTGNIFPAGVSKSWQLTPSAI